MFGSSSLPSTPFCLSPFHPSHFPSPHTHHSTTHSIHFPLHYSASFGRLLPINFLPTHFPFLSSSLFASTHPTSTHSTRFPYTLFHLICASSLPSSFFDPSDFHPISSSLRLPPPITSPHPSHSLPLHYSTFSPIHFLLPTHFPFLSPNHFTSHPSHLPPIPFPSLTLLPLLFHPLSSTNPLFIPSPSTSPQTHHITTLPFPSQFV